MKETLTRRELFQSIGIGALSLVLTAGGCVVNTQGRQEWDENLRANNLPLPEYPIDTVILNSRSPKVLIGGVLVSLGISGLGALASTIWETRRVRQTPVGTTEEINKPGANGCS